MTRNEALKEIADAVQQGLELTGEWGKVYYSKGMFGDDCYYEDPTWMGMDDGDEFVLVENEAVLRITDALERMLIERDCEMIYITGLYRVYKTQAGGVLDEIEIGYDWDKLVSLWKAWKRLDKEQKP